MEYEIWQVWTTAEIKTTSFHEEAGAGFCRKVCSTPSNPTHKLMLLAIMLVYSADMNPRFCIHCNLVSFIEIFFFLSVIVWAVGNVCKRKFTCFVCVSSFLSPHTQTQAFSFSSAAFIPGNRPSWAHYCLYACPQLILPFFCFPFP